MNETNVLINNEYLFGNTFLEMIPHPEGVLGLALNYFSIFCHYLGGVTFFIVLLPFIYFCYNRIFGIKLGIAVLSTSLLNGFAKFYFESVRPFNLSEVFYRVQSDLIKESSYGFPSGHSHVSILVWGMFFLEFKQKWIRALALFIIIFTPFSRMYSGVHFPGDVLGGFSMGFISLVLIEYFFFKYPNFIQLSIKVENRLKFFRSFSLLSIVFTLPFTLLNANSTIQSESSLQQIITSAGSIAGFSIGFLFLELVFPEFSKWDFTSNINDFFYRAFFLLLGILLFYFGLSYIGKLFQFPDIIFRYFRYLILNFYIVGIAPYLYFRIKK